MDQSILIGIQRYSARLRRDPHLKVYAPLGECYRRAGLLDDAEETCMKGLHLFPAYLHCREVLGKVFFQRGNLENAREQLEKVAIIVKESIDLYRTLGKLYAKLDLRELAEKHLEFVLSKDPFDFEARNLLANIGSEDIYEPAEDEEGEVDLFAEKPTNTIYDIEKIIAQNDQDDPADSKASSQATEELLESLDSMEDAFIDQADKMVEEAEEEIGELNKHRATIHRASKYIDHSDELQQAASIAQLHMELSLIDEAIIASKRLLDESPDDPDLLILHRKFEKNLEQKEALLEKLEQSQAI